LAAGDLHASTREQTRINARQPSMLPFELGAASATLALAQLCSVQGARAVQRSFLPFMPTGKAKPTRWRDIAFPGSRLFSISAAASA
jgi:hypothetical protein